MGEVCKHTRSGTVDEGFAVMNTGTALQKQGSKNPNPNEHSVGSFLPVTWLLTGAFSPLRSTGIRGV